MSGDGKISCSERLPLKLSNEEDKKAVDLLRSEMDAILVGSTTVKNDNPSLVLKYEENRRLRIDRGVSADPIKVAISKDCDIPLSSDFIQKGRSEKIHLYYWQRSGAGDRGALGSGNGDFLRRPQS